MAASGIWLHDRKLGYYIADPAAGAIGTAAIPAVTLVDPTGVPISGGGGVVGAAVYNTTPPTYANGDTTAAQADAHGNTRVQLRGNAVALGNGASNFGVAVTDGSTDAATRALWVIPSVFNGTTQDLMAGDTRGIYISSYSPTVISTSTTTVVKNTPGVLHSVVVNSKGTVASTITIYDNTSATGTIVAVIDSLNLSGTFTFDATMSTGITVVTTGTIAPNVTVLWR